MTKPAPYVAPVLTDSERMGQLWKKLVDHMEQRITRLHIELENATTEAKSNEIRGCLRAFRELLRLDKDSPPG